MDIKATRKYLMFFLYKKTHLTTGLMYLGQTKNDPYKYRGSGLYWKQHLKKYGFNVSTEIIKECSTKKELRYWGVHFSQLWKVVESPDWANLKPEMGDGGSPRGTNLGRKHSQETKDKISESKKGKKAPWLARPRTEEERAHLSAVNKGKKLSPETIDKMLHSRAENGNMRHTEATRQKMRKPKSDSAIQNMKEAWKTRRITNEPYHWITNGLENSRIPVSDPIPFGWTTGMSSKPIPPSQKGKIWAHNGEICKMVAEIPPGWSRGRLNKKKNVQ